MRTTFLALLAAASLVAVGCVITTHHTIDAHVTVDIRHIDEQAEDIVSYVTGESDSLPQAATKPAPDAPAPETQKTSWLKKALRSLSPIQTAYAAELKESSPKVKELADKMRSRNAEIQALKAKGYVGENNRGYLDLLPSDDLKDPAKKNDVQKVVAGDNADRKALYREIADLNKDQGVTLSVVERIFAEKWRGQARPGERIQTPPQGPEFEAFQKSALGKKLGADVKPGTWVTVK